MNPFARLLSWLRGPDDRVVIDQDAARREAERRLRADADFRRAIDIEQRKTAMQVGAWTRETVAARCKAPFPGNMRRSMQHWLQGLSGQEITNLSKATREEIRRHVYDWALIAGVRRVQPLDAQDPIFPKSIPPAQILNDRGGGGGIRQKRGDSAGFSDLGGTSWRHS